MSDRSQERHAAARLRRWWRNRNCCPCHSIGKQHDNCGLCKTVCTWTANRHELVGYFTDSAQTEPTYDPPHDAPCLVCWQPVTPEDVRTISLVPEEQAVASVFFRVHRTCAETDPEAVEQIEHRIIEGEFTHA